MRYRKTCALYGEVNMGNPGNVPWCSDKGLEPDCENCTRPGKTNADRIRAMTDEELAKLFVSGWFDGPLFTCPVKDEECESNISCDVCFMEWLKSPVESDDGKI